MKKWSEGRKMWVSVMVIFAIYAVFFIIFDDFDRSWRSAFDEENDLHLVIFSIVVMVGLGALLYRFARSMDERISREQAEKEVRMRRELTQNIAHELKTPVASILGFTETILDNPDMAEEDKQLFLTRTHSQAQRLTALLKDLSMLNRMNNAPQMLSRERVNVSRLFADVVQETALSLQRQQMTVDNRLPEDIIVYGNASLIYSIFRNLIDNAIDYAGKGTTITVRGRQRDDFWQFKISDNGIGIDSQHLERIFERFYRIDEGRSRTLGGSGLGLSIVKNAVLFHQGTITAQSAAGQGLSFVFTLRK